MIDAKLNKNLDYIILRRHSQRKMNLKNQNVIIITLLQNVLQHPFSRGCEKQNLEPNQ